MADGEDLILRVMGGDTRIRLVGALADPVETNIESVTFDDGTVLDRADLLALAMTASPASLAACSARHSICRCSPTVAWSRPSRRTINLRSFPTSTV